MTDNAWATSAASWINELGEAGDFARRFVLDAPMLARVRAGQFATALDVGCGRWPASACGGDPAHLARHRRVPWFLLMEWRKPPAPAGDRG